MGLVQGLHRGIVPDLRESRERLTGNALRRRRIGMEFRMFPFKLQQLFVKKILVTVADDRPRLDVIQPIMAFDLRTEKLDAFLYGFMPHRHPLSYL